MKVQAQQALDFLERWCPGGPWVLTAIHPEDRKQIATRTFAGSEKPELTDWLEDLGQARNVYFAVNPLLRPVTRKAGREDVASLAWLHVDIDPRAGEELASERERALKLLTNPPAGIPVPTCIVFSGGGYQGFWRLQEALAINGQESAAEEAARYNRQLELVFGADHCHNVDRIMRLPGSINWPDKKKQKKGRVPAVAAVVDWDDARAYALSAFTPAPEIQDGELGFSSGAVKVSGNVARIADVGELPPGVSDKCKVVIVQGQDPDDNSKHGSRSEWLFFVCCELVRAGCTDDVIFSVITDPEFGISSSVLDKGSRSDKYAVRQIERAREHAIDPNLMELNERHAVIGSVGGKCRIISEERDDLLGRSSIAFQSATDFKLRYMNRRIEMPGPNGSSQSVPLGHWWLGHTARRQYDGITFAPGREVTGSYNMWKGFAYDARPGNCDFFLQHVHENVCGGVAAHTEYVLKWMATAVQKPAQQGHTAIVLRGRQGTGKGYMVKTFGRLFGRHFFQVSDPSHLIGNFNAHLRDCVLLFADEAFYAGDKKHASTLKMIVTEEMLAVEAKGVDVVAASNFVHLMMASNESWVVPAGLDERRFVVLDVGDGRKQDLKFFRDVQAQMDNGGYEALLHHLMTMDLSGFDVRSLPRTKALLDQKVWSFLPEEEWWYSKLREGEVIEGRGWPEHVAASELAWDFSSYQRAWNATHRSNSTRLGRFMQRVCPNDWKLRTQLSGSMMVRLGTGEMTKVDRPRVYAIPRLEVARAHWDANFGGPYDWPAIDTMQPVESGQREF